MMSSQNNLENDKSEDKIKAILNDEEGDENDEEGEESDEEGDENDEEGDESDESDEEGDDRIIRIEETSHEDGFKCIKEFEGNNLRREIWFKNGLLNSYNDQPALIKYDRPDINIDVTDLCLYKIWYKDSRIHRDNNPAMIISAYDDDNVVDREFWYQNGKLHRVGGPAEIRYKGVKISEKHWYKNGKLNSELSENGTYLPAQIGYDYNTENVTSKAWWKEGKMHREDGPAWIWYYTNGVLKRERWYQNGQLYRSTEGPVSADYDTNGKMLPMDGMSQFFRNRYGFFF